MSTESTVGVLIVDGFVVRLFDTPSAFAPLAKSFLTVEGTSGSVNDNKEEYELAVRLMVEGPLIPTDGTGGDSVTEFLQMTEIPS